MAKRIREARAALRDRFPTAYELIYDDYNFFVIGYCASEKPASCVVSLVADKKGVLPSFYRGADLPDPHGLLIGSGSRNRFLRLPDGAAEAQAPVPMRQSGSRVTVPRSVSAKQRPRRDQK
jgi:hypothetical protein